MKPVRRKGRAPHTSGETDARFMPFVVLAVVVATAIAVLILPDGRGELLVKLVTGLEWLLVLLVAAVVFHRQGVALADAIVERVTAGASLNLWGAKLESLPESARKIPSPASAADPVSLTNVALLHTSFLRPDKTREFNDGRTYYQFEVIVMAPDDVLQRIESVIYQLDNAWPKDQRVKEITDRASRFKMQQLANGTSIVVATVQLRDQDQPVVLNRFIDLRPDGPRI